MFNGTLESSSLKHDPEYAKTLYANKGNTVVAKDDIYIMFPDRYINKRLATMGSVVKLISIYAMIGPNKRYGVINAPVFVDITPNNVTNVLVDGVAYLVLEIAKGSTFITNRDLVQDESFMYDLFDEFFLQGKIPWYLTYDRLSRVFAEAGKYAGSGIGKDPLAMDIITSLIARTAKDKRVSFRHAVKSKGDNNKPVYVGLNNVFYAYDNTLSKVMGGYMQQGVTVAITNKEDESTKVSALLRK